MQKITTFLWFHEGAEEAARFYVSLFPDSQILGSSPQSVKFRLAGQEYIGLNGGSYYTMTPAISLYIDCGDQAEVDRYWAAFLEGGQAQQCGWITDRFGVTWQVVPRRLGELLENPATAGRTMEAMMKMVKLDVAALEAAAAGR
jgi:predicted 3-demethylubiquinone-9 3-methyltransferase (glyoxalase superfamily)